MKIVPYRDRSRRLEKVVRHYYALPERWWEITEPSLQAWTGEWNSLRGLGVFLREQSWLLIEPDTPADALCAKAHARWLAIAELACDQARVARTVYPAEKNRVCYVGRDGVTVYVTTDQRPRLVTCFRVLDAGARRNGKTDRAAVRRAQRRASWDVGRA